MTEMYDNPMYSIHGNLIPEKVAERIRKADAETRARHALQETRKIYNVRYTSTMFASLFNFLRERGFTGRDKGYQLLVHPQYQALTIQGTYTDADEKLLNELINEFEAPYRDEAMTEEEMNQVLTPVAFSPVKTGKRKRLGRRRYQWG